MNSEVTCVWFVVSTALLCAAVLSVSFVVDYRRTKDVLNIKNILLINILLINAIQPVASIFTGDMRFTDIRSSENVVALGQSCAFTLIGILMFVLGLHAGFGRNIAMRVAALLENWRPALGPFKGFTTVLLVAAIGASAYLFTHVGVDGTRYLDKINDLRYNGGVAIPFGQKMLITLGSGAYFYILICAIIIDQQCRIRTGTGNRFFLIIAVLCPVMTLASGFRGPFVISTIVLLAYMHRYVRRITILQLVGISVGIAVMVAAAGITRAELEQGQRIGGKSLSIESVNHEVIQRTRGIETMVVTLNSFATNNQAKHMYFVDTLYELATLLVPRSWVNWKPTPVSYKFGEQVFGAYLYERDGALGGETNGFSAPLVSFLYWEGGVLGVLVGGFLVGVAVRVYNNIYYTTKVSFTAMAIYFAAAPGVIAIGEHLQVGLDNVEVNIVAISCVMGVCALWPRRT